MSLHSAPSHSVQVSDPKEAKEALEAAETLGLELRNVKVRGWFSGWNGCNHPSPSPEFHQVQCVCLVERCWLIPPVIGIRWQPRNGCTRTMNTNSERHGRYVARWRNGRKESGFDARLVLEQRQRGGS